MVAAQPRLAPPAHIMNQVAPSVQSACQASAHASQMLVSVVGKQQHACMSTAAVVAHGAAAYSAMSSACWSLVRNVRCFLIALLRVAGTPFLFLQRLTPPEEVLTPRWGGSLTFKRGMPRRLPFTDGISVAVGGQGDIL